MMSQARKPRLLVFATALWCGVAVLGCGNQGSDATRVQSSANPAEKKIEATTLGRQEYVRGREVSLRVFGVENGRRVRVRTPDLVVCPGIHAWPHITGVREVDRPRGIVLTVYVKGGPTPGCAGVMTSDEEDVWLRATPNGRPIYDGSKSPSLRRWPKPPS
jgi:hypothetical protein